MIVDEFCFDGFEVELHRAARERIQVFKRNGPWMQTVNGLQHLERRRARARIADAREVVVEIQCV